MAPTALLSSWGAGRPEPRGHPYGSCNGERAAQVPRDATPHTALCHDEELQGASSPWRWHQVASSPSPGIGAQLGPCPPAHGSASAGSCGAGKEGRAVVTQSLRNPQVCWGLLQSSGQGICLWDTGKSWTCSSPGPCAGYKDAGSDPPSSTRAFTPLLRWGKTDPPLTSHTWPPQPSLSPRVAGADVRQQMHPVPGSGSSGGGTSGRLQISRLLTALVILSTHGGAGGSAWQHGQDPAGSPGPDGPATYTGSHQQGGDGERGTARLRPEPCLALSQLQQISARRRGGSAVRTGTISCPRPPTQGGLLQRQAEAAGPGQTLQLTAPGQAARGLGLPAEKSEQLSPRLAWSWPSPCSPTQLPRALLPSPPPHPAQRGHRKCKGTCITMGEAIPLRAGSAMCSL